VSLAVGRRGRVEPDDTLFDSARSDGMQGPIEHAGNPEGRLASVAVGSSDLPLEIDSTVPAQR
jgi:hypothetical protein